jgi:hypothetical protein
LPATSLIAPFFDIPEILALTQFSLAHDLFRKPVPTLGSSPRAGFFGIMVVRGVVITRPGGPGNTG